jgi:hypothetical protein
MVGAKFFFSQINRACLIVRATDDEPAVDDIPAVFYISLPTASQIFD